MSTQELAIAFVPRETVSRSIDSLNAILEHTPMPYQLILVVACYPEEIRAELRRIGAEREATIVELEGFVTPNEARNAALAVVDSRYVAFLDNDIEVRDDWLSPLLEAAHETQATIVAPLIYELYPAFTRIHLAGGVARLGHAKNGGHYMVEKHHHGGRTETAEMNLVAPFESELAEFHAIVIDVAWLRKQGGLDPELCCTEEHWDICVAAREQGKTIVVVPASKVNYSPPRKPTLEDLRYFDIRWSWGWFSRGADRLMAKHRLTRRAAYRGWKWVVRHRAHPLAQQLRERFPWMSRDTAYWLQRKVLIPLSDAFPPKQRQDDLAEWSRRRKGSEWKSSRGITSLSMGNSAAAGGAPMP